MALVAYDNSDSSEYEEEDNESTPVVALTRKTEPVNEEPTTSKPGTNGVQTGPGDQKLFNLLPQPSSKISAVVEEDDEFLHKKETAPNVPKPKAKITVPSLSDFKDVEDRPIAKPKISNEKKSGLLSMLPQPRNAAISSKTTSLVPNVLTKKPSTSLIPDSVKKKQTLPSPAKKAKSDNKLISYSDESDNDEDGESSDFFSINKPVDLPPVEDTPLDIDIPLPVPKAKAEKRGIESYFKKDIPEHVVLQPDYSEPNIEPTDYYSAMEAAGYSNGDEPQSSASTEAVLDEEALRQLVGSRGKRRKEDIQIVDVNQEEVLGDSREWLLKGLMDDTTKRVSASKKKGHEPSAQQRRKHQITYLAHQAKANEAELQNQWANNRMSKRQTQSKYGF